MPVRWLCPIAASPRARKDGLTASVLNGTAHRGFDEITEGLSFGDHGVELSAQPRCDTDQRDDSGFHFRSVVRLLYTAQGASGKAEALRKFWRCLLVATSTRR